MTEKEKDNYWRTFHRFQMRYEEIYAPKINKALKAQIQQYIQNRDILYVRSGGLYAVLLDLYTKTGTVWARHSRSLQNQMKATGQMGFSERIVTFMRQYFGFDLLNHAEGMTRTTIRIIQDVLSEAALEGWSFDEIVKRLELPELTAKRARLIARTETVGAANAASLYNATAGGGEANKIWIAARDSRTRMHHREVDNKVVGKDERFKVGNSMMLYPGDKAGSAEEVCNCRCVIAFIPIEEKAIEPPEPVDYAPYFDKTENHIKVLGKSFSQQKEEIIQANTDQVKVFTDILKSTIEDIPAPVVNIEAPIVNIPEPVVNVEAPIVNVTEQKVDQTEVVNLINVGVEGIVQVGRNIIAGQQEIIRLQKESMKPQPKKKWEFDTVMEGGRIKRVIAKEI